jgi:predicted metalloprotease with PDZ domain
MRWKVVSMFALAAILATSVFAGEKCTTDTQTCLSHWAAKSGTQTWLGISKEKTDAGYKVTAVDTGSPAEKAGFKVGDVLLAVNGMAVGSDELKKSYETIYKVGATVKYTVNRSGKEQILQATLVKMPENVFAQMVGSHMLEHASTQSAAK